MFISIVEEKEEVLKNIKECTVYVDEEALQFLSTFAEYCRTKNEAESHKKEMITLLTNGEMVND